MADTQARRDPNRVPSLIGVDNITFEDTQTVAVNSDHEMLVSAAVTASIDTTGLATDTNQTNGAQKTQIVDAGGEAVTVTGGKLDVNASASLAGEAIPISGATTAVGVAIVDGSGNQITSFGGGTQYTEGDTDASITGTAAMMEVGSNTLQPVQGSVADGLLVNLGTNNDVTVTGSITANAGTNLNTSLLATSANQTNGTQKTIIVDATGADMDLFKEGDNFAVGGDHGVAILGLSDGTPQKYAFIRVEGTDSDTETPLTKGAVSSESYGMVYNGSTWDRSRGSAADGTLVNLGTNNDVTVTGSVTEANSGAIKTSVELIDNAVSGAGFNITQLGGASVPIGAGTEAAAIRVTLPTDGTGKVTVVSGTAANMKVAATLDAETTKVIGTVNVAAGNNNIGDVDVASIAAGNNNIGDVDVASIAAGNNNIGDVDVASVPADPFGANADAASATGSISAKLRFLAASGIAGMTILPAGTNAIGKLLPPDIDITTHTNYARKYYTNAGAVTDGIVWSPAAGKRWHVTTLYLNVSAAATVTLEDDKAGGDDPVWKGELAANSGVVLTFDEKYPMASGEDAADLLITTSAGNVYVTVVGYEI